MIVQLEDVFIVFPLPVILHKLDPWKTRNVKKSAINKYLKCLTKIQGSLHIKGLIAEILFNLAGFT